MQCSKSPQNKKNVTMIELDPWSFTLSQHNGILQQMLTLVPHKTRS